MSRPTVFKTSASESLPNRVQIGRIGRFRDWIMRYGTSFETGATEWARYLSGVPL